MRSLGWCALVVTTWIMGAVACSKIPGIGGAPSSPVFNVIEVGGLHVYELRLKDGTHCAVYASNSITCDWNNK